MASAYARAAKQGNSQPDMLSINTRRLSQAYAGGVQDNIMELGKNTALTGLL
jgi:hypothetical protein